MSTGRTCVLRATLSSISIPSAGLYIAISNWSYVSMKPNFKTFAVIKVQVVDWRLGHFYGQTLLTFQTNYITSIYIRTFIVPWSSQSSIQLMLVEIQWGSPDTSRQSLLQRPVKDRITFDTWKICQCFLYFQAQLSRNSGPGCSKPD